MISSLVNIPLRQHRCILPLGALSAHTMSPLGFAIRRLALPLLSLTWPPFPPHYGKKDSLTDGHFDTPAWLLWERKERIVCFFRGASFIFRAAVRGTINIVPDARLTHRWCSRRSEMKSRGALLSPGPMTHGALSGRLLWIDPASGGSRVVGTWGSGIWGEM